MIDIVAEMEKGWNEKILFSVSEFKGKKYADLRIYYEDDEGEWKPTRKGLSISMEAFAEFKEHLLELEEHLQSAGLLQSAEYSD